MRLIDADALCEGLVSNHPVAIAAKCAPTIDAVSLGVLKQFKWERDTAISQLEELGLGFGQKIPDMVEVVRCRDCIAFGKSPYGHPGLGWCRIYGHHFNPDYYCASGRRKDDDSKRRP